MKRVNNERGIALVMALILTVIMLVAVSALIYLVTQGTAMSGYQKRYQTALEAAKGGVDLVTTEVIGKTIGGTALSSLGTYSGLMSVSSSNDACFSAKLLRTTTSTTYGWPSGCSSTLDPKDSPDITFTFSGLAPQPNFNVYAKIVDTVGCTSATNCPNSDVSGLNLQGSGGVVEAGSGMISPKQVPYMYRIEIRAERATNPDESSNLSVLYAY
jgi:hypothetical protein